MSFRPVMLCILDGVGWGRRDETDAVFMARTPVLDGLMRDYPHTLLRAHGTAVGLPSEADMGNSEVGHNAMGAGRVVDQGAKLVDYAIASGELFSTDAWLRIAACRTVHFIGLVSDGNVHSHVKHLNALIDAAHAAGVARIRVHVLTDGRDVPDRSAPQWVGPLEARLAALPDGAVASGGGRMSITMDRYEADWQMVKRGWDTHVHGVGRPFPSASIALETLYAEDPKASDQWLAPFVVVRDGAPVGRIQDGDGVVLFNFRGDRAIELSRAFDDDDFPFFDRGFRPKVAYAGIMQYDGDLKVPRSFLVNPPAIDHTVGQYLVAAGVRTGALSETQKYGHVTYFFNGNRSGRLDDTLEEYVEIPSDNVPFDQAPAMKAAAIASRAAEMLRSGRFDFVRLNIANGDMVGHTGNFAATVVAMEVVDAALGVLVEAARAVNAILLVTADHGNADLMVELDHRGRVVLAADGTPKARTSHSLNPVPFILVDPLRQWRLVPPAGAGIASVGGTLLALFGVPLPEGYLPPLVTLAAQH